MSQIDLDTHDSPKGDRIAKPPYRAWIGPKQESRQHTLPSGDIIHLPGPMIGKGRYVDFPSLPEAGSYVESFSGERQRTIFLEHQYTPGEWMVLPKNPGLRAWS